MTTAKEIQENMRKIGQSITAHPKSEPTWHDYADAIEEVIEAYEAETERWTSRRNKMGMRLVIEERRKVAALAREGLKPNIKT